MKYINMSKHAHKPDKKEKKGSKTPFLVISGFIVLATALFFLSKPVKAIFNPVSIIANISGVSLKETDGRTNVLILGSDKRTNDDRDSILTDTILVASIGRVEKDVVMISLPRDLWVKSSQGYYEKINAMYAIGGAQETTKVIESVLGIPVHYYAVMDFNLFKETVDTLGGIEVYVENGFTDYYYPLEGKENAPLTERYETVTFEQGQQNMTGETALKFVRSRKGNNNEGTDFARAARQQKVIMAIKNKALSLNTLVNPTKIKELYDIYAYNVDTNVTFTDIQNFYLLSQQIDFDQIESIVLDDRSMAQQGGLLYAPEDTSLYGGAYVLLPKAGDYSQLHAYVQKFLFER